jgi:hypothetical protein
MHKLTAEELRSKILGQYESCAKEQGIQFREEDLLVSYTNEYELNMFYELKARGDKSRSTKKFKITEVSRLDELSEQITDYSLAVQSRDHDSDGRKLKQKELFVGDRMGFYRVDFSDGSFMFFVKWVIGVGKTKTVDGLYVASKDTWLNFFGILQEEKKRITKPKKGVYRIRVSNGGELEYEKVKEIKETPVSHQFRCVWHLLFQKRSVLCSQPT